MNHQHGDFYYEMNNFFNVYFEYKGFTVNIVSSTIHTHCGGKSLKGSHVSLIIHMALIMLQVLTLETCHIVPCQLFQKIIVQSFMILTVISMQFTSTIIYFMFEKWRKIMTITGITLWSGINTSSYSWLCLQYWI